MVAGTEPQTLSVLRGKLRSHLTLLVRHLVELVALDTCYESGIGHLVHQFHINGLLFLTHLLVYLILGLDSALSIKVVQGKVNKLVVGLCLLGIVDQLAKRRLQHSCCLGIVLRFQDALQGFAVTCKRGRCGKQHQSRKHDFLHKLILMFKKVC